MTSGRLRASLAASGPWLQKKSQIVDTHHSREKMDTHQTD